MSTEGRSHKESRTHIASGDRIISAMLVPVVRLLVRHGYGVGDFLQAAKLAYVEAAIAEFVPAGAKANISLLSVVTGLTRKDVSALIQARERRKPYITKRTMPQRALRVLQGWQVDPRFTKSDGKPLELFFSSGRSSFMELVRKYGGDVTPVAVLSELHRMGAVRRRKRGSLYLVRSSIRRDPNPEVIEIAQLIGDFAESMTSNNANGRPPLFRGFRDAELDSPDQAGLFKRTFARRGVALLDSVSDWLDSQKTERSTSRRMRREPIRVGLGVYVVEKPPSLPWRKRR